jgi:hypothetical protein
MTKRGETKRRRTITLFEIFLIVSLTITTTYFIHEASTPLNNLVIPKQQSKLDQFIAVAAYSIGNILFGQEGIVSALTSEDTSNGAYTCLVSKNGSICQQYLASECNSYCNSSCIASSRDYVSECTLGTCYDSLEGTCTSRATRKACESYGGIWSDDVYSNLDVCQKACCTVGANTWFTTEKTCERKSSLLGLQKNFSSEIDTELECYVAAQSDLQGACTFTSDYETTCKFTTRAECLKLSGSFHEDSLCSASEFKASCTKQATVGCVSGKDEIYWFDSCGNRENIYEGSTTTQKEHSYNSGKILLKNDSCSIGTSSNNLANQGTCGNCNYLYGSTCGLKTTSEYLDDTGKNVVCRDLRCNDGGKIRENGESWCVYQSAIGEDTGAGGYERSIDVPGSRSFRKTCINGDIETEPCADYRNEICTESRTEKYNSYETISSAACRTNLKTLCFYYVAQYSDGDLSQTEMEEKCSANPDCIVKQVNLGENFKFSTCAPRYPPGFDLSSDDTSTSASTLCGYATQKCTVIYVKQLFKGWVCKKNCRCESYELAEQMNDLCISMGDCGSKANLAGDITYNHRIYKSSSSESIGSSVYSSGTRGLSSDYLTKLKKYSSINNSPTSYIKSTNLSAYYASIGADSLNTASDPTGLDTSQIGLYAGAVGVAVLAVGYAVGAATTAATGILPTITAGLQAANMLNIAGTTIAGLGAAAGALAGAAIAVAVVSLLIKYLGISAGIPEWVMYSLLGAAAIGGAMIGFTLVKVGLAACMAGAIGCVVGVVIIIIVILIIVIMKLLGIGKIKKYYYTFQCNPWEAPSGGSHCSDCGKDGLTCGKYACQSYGQNCELINEDTGYQSCINSNPYDVNAPVIKPLSGVLSSGWSYEEKSNGVVIKSSDNDGCLKSYENMIFGLRTENGSSVGEYAQCHYSTTAGTDFDSMETDFGATNLYLVNHTQTIVVPDLAAFGGNQYDPNSKVDYNLYVKCKDKSGNINSVDYDVNFCVKPGIDVSPPVILSRSPSYKFVSYFATQLNGSVIINEPATCRYSSTDMDYDSMTNSMDCNTDVSLGSWDCSTTFSLTEGSNNLFYIRCKDKPWLIENETGKFIIVDSSLTSEDIDSLEDCGSDCQSVVSDQQSAVQTDLNATRIAMDSSYIFEINRSKSLLKIDSLTPNGTIMSGTKPVSVKIKVTTSGGVDNGNSDCTYSIRADSYLPLVGDSLLPMGTTAHEATLQLFDGGHIVNVTCTDLAKNKVSKETSFDIQLDTDTPIVTRAYKDGSNLNVITNEASTCRYRSSIAFNSDTCWYDFTNSTSMSGSSVSHTTPFNVDSIYYVKCKDSYGNENSGCGIIVKGSDLRVS